MNLKEQPQKEPFKERVDPEELRIYSKAIRDIVERMNPLLERYRNWLNMSSFTGSGPKTPTYDQSFSPEEQKKLRSLKTLGLIERSLNEGKVKLGEDGRIKVWKVGEWKDLENLIAEHEMIING
jgi:hypothetical protein